MRIRCYNEKGAKFTTTLDKAVLNDWYPVEGIELLHRKDLWERKIVTVLGMSESVVYYNSKRDACIEKLDALRKLSLNIPRSVKEIPNEVR